MSQKIKNLLISIASSRKTLLIIMGIIILSIVIPVLATYTGPNRTIQEKQCHDEKVITGCYYTMPAADEFHLNCKVASTYPGCPHPAAEFFAGCDGNSTLHYIKEDQEVCEWVTVAAPPATVNGSVSCTNGTNGWCRSDATLNITGSDPNPANTIIAIEGTRNGTDFACASDTCQIDATGNGSFAFEYWAVSSHGDTSYKGNTTITVDKDAPVVGLNLSGSMGYNSWYVSGVNWTTSLTDSVSGPSHVNVSVDGASQSNPGSYATDGTHTIKATGYDNAGNSSQTQQTVQIDQTNPLPAYTLNGSLGTNSWYTSAVNWNASATDATSGVYAVATQLDGASVNNSASIGTNGSHTLQVTAQDNAGNLTSTSGSFKIDQEDPFVSLNLSGTQGTHSWYTGPVSWSSTASDTVSGLASHIVTLNGSTTTVNGSVNSDGTYTLIATAQDNASNQSTQTQSFGIDQSAPTVSMNPISGTHSNTVQLSGNSTDATSGISYVEISIAGQTHQVNSTGAWSYQWNSTSACNGSVTASVRSVDQAGNVSPSTTQTFTVENTPTTLTLPAQTDASNPVVFNLNTSNLNQMVIRISDDVGNLPAVTHTFTGTAIPSSYRWDRYMGDGSLAPKGTYTMNVRIYDKNTCTTDTASITLVVTESILSAWVSGAPTNTPIPPQFTPTEPANLSEDQIGQVESESFQTSLTPTIETTVTNEAIVVLPTQTPTSTPTTTPNPNPFVLPKADQKTTTSTSSSPKAPNSITDPIPAPTTLSTGVLIGTSAAGLIGSIAAYQAAVEAERKRKEAEAKKRAEELMHQRNKLIKEGIDPTGMNTKEISKLTEKIDKANKARDAYIYNSVIASGGDPDMSIEDARAIFTNSSIKKNDGDYLTEQEINKRVDYAIDYQEKMRKQEEALAEFMALEIAKEEYRLEQEAKQLKGLENQNQNTQDTGRVITKPLSKGKQAQIDALEQRDDFNHKYYEKIIDKGSEAYKQAEATAINIALETFRKKQQRKNNQANPVSAGKQVQIDALEQRNDNNNEYYEKLMKEKEQWFDNLMPKRQHSNVVNATFLQEIQNKRNEDGPRNYNDEAIEKIIKEKREKREEKTYENLPNEDILDELLREKESVRLTEKYGIEIYVGEGAEWKNDYGIDNWARDNKNWNNQESLMKDEKEKITFKDVQERYGISEAGGNCVNYAIQALESIGVNVSSGRWENNFEHLVRVEPFTDFLIDSGYSMIRIPVTMNEPLKNGIQNPNPANLNEILYALNTYEGIIQEGDFITYVIEKDGEIIKSHVAVIDHLEKYSDGTIPYVTEADGSFENEIRSGLMSHDASLVSIEIYTREAPTK